MASFDIFCPIVLNRLSFVDTEPPNEPPQHTKAQGNSSEKSAFSRYYVAHKIHIKFL